MIRRYRGYTLAEAMQSLTNQKAQLHKTQTTYPVEEISNLKRDYLKELGVSE